jgi:hypothetical protein
MIRGAFRGTCVSKRVDLRIGNLSVLSDLRPHRIHLLSPREESGLGLRRKRCICDNMVGFWAFIEDLL